MNQSRYFYIKLGRDTFSCIVTHGCSGLAVFGWFIFANPTLDDVFPGEFDMLVDEGSEAIHEVETIIVHNNYRPDTFHNDIALIKLATPINYSKFILPACIPEQEFAESVNQRTHQTPSLHSLAGISCIFLNVKCCPRC